MYKTYYPKASEIDRKWYVADADGQNLGRFAAHVAHILLGKHKPTFTPGVEIGDYVVIVNAERVTVTGTTPFAVTGNQAAAIDPTSSTPTGPHPRASAMQATKAWRMKMKSWKGARKRLKR